MPTAPASESGADRSALCAVLRGEALPLTDRQLDALHSLATDHRVHVLLAEALSHLPNDRASSPPREALQEAARHAAIVEWLRAEDLRRVLAMLAAAGVPGILVKGVALAYTCYEEPSHRPHVDIDLLIRREDADRVRRVMEQGGYLAPHRVDGERVMHQFQFTRRLQNGADCEYDFHWRVANPELFAHVLTFDDLSASARPVPALSEHARAPADLQSLFLACIHRVAHHYDDDALVWLYDIHLLSRRLCEDDWDRFAALAQRTQTRTVCAHGLRTAAEAFGTLIPSSVLARLSTKEHEPSATFLAPTLRTIDVELSTLRQLPTWRARAELVWQHLFPRPAFIMSAYGVKRRAWLPVLYTHRAARGALRWMRPLAPPR
ncbi:MAG TPA: nucleotidyltransferase family protein [Vicinamibacterales bacterium]